MDIYGFGMQIPMPAGFSATVICGHCAGKIEPLPSGSDQPDHVVCVNCGNTATVQDARCSVKRFAKHEHVRQLYMEATRKTRSEKSSHGALDLSDDERFPFVLKPD